jgi:hypothetical protein
LTLLHQYAAAPADAFRERLPVPVSIDGACCMRWPEYRMVGVCRAACHL